MGSGCVGEVIGGLLSLMARQFLSSLVITVSIIGGLFLVYFLIGFLIYPKRTMARLRHRPKQCLDCQVLRKLVHQKVREAEGGPISPIQMWQIQRGFVVEFNEFYRHGRLTLSIRLVTSDGVTHAVSYDSKTPVPEEAGTLPNNAA